MWFNIEAKRFYTGMFSVKNLDIFKALQINLIWMQYTVLFVKVFD